MPRRRRRANTPTHGRSRFRVLELIRACRFTGFTPLGFARGARAHRLEPAPNSCRQDDRRRYHHRRRFDSRRWSPRLAGCDSRPYRHSVRCRRSGGRSTRHDNCIRNRARMHRMRQPGLAFLCDVRQAVRPVPVPRLLGDRDVRPRSQEGGHRGTSSARGIVGRNLRSSDHQRGRCQRLESVSSRPHRGPDSGTKRCPSADIFTNW